MSDVWSEISDDGEIDPVVTEAPEPDLIEQRLPPDGEPTLSPAAESDPEVPEADAWEQALPVGDEPNVRPTPILDQTDLEVPEADAWEQQQPVVGEGEY